MEDGAKIAGSDGTARRLQSKSKPFSSHSNVCTKLKFRKMFAKILAKIEPIESLLSLYRIQNSLPWLYKLPARRRPFSSELRSVFCLLHHSCRPQRSRSA